MVASTYPVATLAEACVIRDARGMLSRCALLLGDGVNVSVHVAHIHDTRTRACSEALLLWVAEHALHELRDLLPLCGVAVARTSDSHECCEEEDTRHGSEMPGWTCRCQSAITNANVLACLRLTNASIWIAYCDAFDSTNRM